MPRTTAPRLAVALVLIPLLGFVAAQTLTARIEHPSEWTKSYVHTLATSTFAIVFLISTVINAVVISRSHLDRPVAHSSRRLITWQLVLVVLGAGWLVCLAIGNGAFVIEQGFGVAIAIASIVVLVRARHD